MRRTATCTQHLLLCMLKLTNGRHKVGYSLQNGSAKAASPLTLHQIPQRRSSIDAAEGVEKQPYRLCRNSVTVFSKQTGPITGGRHLGLMLRCLATVPRLRSHQHQKLQSSSYCFHCSTTCSPTHSHVHTHTRAHSFCDYPHLCFSQSPPPPLSTPSIPVTERIPPYFSFSFSPSLHPPSLRSTRALTTQPNSRCCSQGAVCSSAPPPSSVMCAQPPSL